MKKFLIFVFSCSLAFTIETAIIKVDGMTCPLCTTAIKHSLKHTFGVLKAKVRLNTKLATVVFDEKKTNIKKILDAIKVVGYKGNLIKLKKGGEK